MTSENSRIKITASSLKSLLPGYIHWDTEVKGFGIRCRANTLTYIVKTRINGKQKWLTIGQHGSPWTPVSARKEALRLLSETASGTDPSAVRSAKRREQTYSKMIEEFLEDHLSKLKPRTRHDYQRILKNDILPMIGALLGHTQSQTTARYAHLADDPLRQLNQEVGDLIAGAMKGE